VQKINIKQTNMSKKKGIRQWVVFVALACSLPAIGQQHTVLLDNFFNREYRPLPNGGRELYHYTWSDTAQSGYSDWGRTWRDKGLRLATLNSRPSAASLKKASVYILPDPDTERDTDKPQKMDAATASVMLKWVQKGGVLVVMGNDSLNSEQQAINLLTQPAGIRMAGDSRNPVHNDVFQMGAVLISDGHPIFALARTLFLKEVSSLELTGAARAFLSHHADGYVIGAYSPYGKGHVVVVGDPWLYNEYVNGKLPDSFDNDMAMTEFTFWLVSLIKK